MNNIYNIIKELELSLLRPEVRSSRESLDNLLADDFMEIGTFGDKFGKKDTLENLPNTKDKIEFKVSNFEVYSPMENVAIATFITEKITNDKDSVTAMRSSHWRKVNGQWQMYFHQATKIS
jgi:hypothetical protein